MSREVLVPPETVGRWVEGVRPPVAVTGGTGFVGSHLVETLVAAGHRPRVLVRDLSGPRWIAGLEVEWLEGDLGNDAALERLVDGAGTVFHLAGVVRAGSSELFREANARGTARLAAAFASRGAPEGRFVYVSSLAAVGPSSGIEGVGPEAEPRPISAYGRSKLEGEVEVRRVLAGRRWIILRPPAIYGPRDVDILEFFRLAARGLVPIPSGERWLTLAHVADVVRAVLAAAQREAPVGRVLHLGEPRPYRMEAVVRLLADAGGVPARILRVPAPLVRLVGFGGTVLQRVGFRKVAMTADKAREMLARHWTSRTADSLQALGIHEWIEFHEGARETWAWYRERGWVR